MPQDPLHLLLLASLLLAAAILYSTVGLAGASGYIAAMALVGVSAPVIKPAALVMNVVVAVVSTWRFTASDFVPWRLLLPLVVGSVPTAFLGGLATLPTDAHRFLLAAVLLIVGGRLWWAAPPASKVRPPGPLALLVIGAALGALAGLTGVGGGMLLSPLLMFAGWEDTRHASGAAAVFNLANSVSGLAGHIGGGHAIPIEVAILAPIALVGGLCGSWLGTRHFDTKTLRRLLSVVLLVAALKLMLVR
jgi:uncharacterized membrane protein YfcA